MLLAELQKIMVKKVTFVGFRGVITPIARPGSAPATNPDRPILKNLQLLLHSNISDSDSTEVVDWPV